MADVPDFAASTAEKASRRRLWVFVVIGVALLLAVAIWILRQEQIPRANAAAVIEGVRVSYPAFCRGSQILARELSSIEIANNNYRGRPLTTEPRRYWGIQCEPNLRIYHGFAAIIDVRDCIAMESMPNSLTFFQIYHAAFQGYDGKKMALCPVI
jgi:hypothetical protein